MNMRMIKILTGILLMTATCYHSAIAQTVYKKVNKDGSVQYSDLPFPGAETITIKKSTQTTLPSVNFKPKFSQPELAKINHSVQIISPQNGETIRNNSGNFTIMVQTTAMLSSDLKLQLFLNNIPFGEPSEDIVFKVKNVDRGEIKIKYQLQDSYGNILATSPMTVVFLHRARISRAR